LNGAVLIRDRETPEPVSVIVPDMVTGTISPLGGQRDNGLAEITIAGGVLSAIVVMIADAADPELLVVSGSGVLEVTDGVFAKVPSAAVALNVA
jgi:hypothetical protein